LAANRGTASRQSTSVLGTIRDARLGNFDFLGLLITQVITVVVYVALTGGTAPRPGSLALENLKYDGRLLSWSTFATAIICGLAIVIVVKLKRGSKLSDYLGLIFPNLRQLFFWLVALICLHRHLRWYFRFIRQADDTGIHGESLLVAGIALDLMVGVAGRCSFIRGTFLSRIFLSRDYLRRCCAGTVR